MKLFFLDFINKTFHTHKNYCKNNYLYFLFMYKLQKKPLNDDLVVLVDFYQWLMINYFVHQSLMSYEYDDLH